MARGLVITESASGFCICPRHSDPSPASHSPKDPLQRILKSLHRRFDIHVLAAMCQSVWMSLQLCIYLLQEDGHMRPELFLQLGISGE